MSNQKSSHSYDNGTRPAECDKQFSTVVIKFSNQVEDIIAWLFCKEEQLQLRPNESTLQDATFNLVLDEYSYHEKFMTEICEYCHTIMKCKEEGQELRDNDDKLNDEERDEIGIQMDAMLVLYDKLKILTTDRLHHLQRIVDERQRSNIDRLEKWIAFMEMKLASSDSIGPDYDALQDQMIEVDELKKELEQKQEFLNLVSRLIIFDDVDLGSSYIESRNCENLEGRLEDMNGRWTGICQLVNERHGRLRKADAIWKLLHLEGPQLASWLKKVHLGLNELLDAIQNVTDPQAEKSFVSKLVTRSDRIESEIKNKQSFYTSLENRIRMEIEKFDDPCSMFVIELEKKLEDMQDNWNQIMRQKRMIDYKLQAMSNPDTILNDAIRPIIPVPDSITKRSNNDLKSYENGSINSDKIAYDRDSCNDALVNSTSTGDHDLDSTPHFSDSLSDGRGFENSSSSHDTKSLNFGINNNLKYQEDGQPKSGNEDDSHEMLSSATNLSLTNHGNLFSAHSNNDSSYSFMGNDELRVNAIFPDLNNKQSPDDRKDSSNCGSRVHEWKRSYETLSMWLQKVERSLSSGTINPTSGECSLLKEQSWPEIDLVAKLSLVQSLEEELNSSVQEQYKIIIMQGQNVIENIGDSAEVEEMLANIAVSYNSFKNNLNERKRDLMDRERWRNLSTKLQNTCQELINHMGDLIPENEIGVDLITLAQQQDQLMHSKEELESNTALNECIKESKLFLKVHDMLTQHTGPMQHTSPTIPVATSQGQMTCNMTDIWLSFREFKDEIENHLDRLTLHYSELSQIIDDRLERLDEIYKEMHALQRSIQDLAAKLQVSEILKSNWVALDQLSIEQLSEQLEDLKLYRERLVDVESARKEMNSIVDWMEQYGAPLSRANMSRIDELNVVWNSIQSSVEDRQKLIEQAFDEQSGSEQRFLAETVADLPKWERRVATSKVPYFIDHESRKTLWDHPKFTKILDTMDECKQYVFSAYRTAMKLRLLQKSLGIDKLMLEQLKDVHSKFDMLIASGSKENSTEMQNISSRKNSKTIGATVGIEQVISLLKMIYDMIQATELPSLNIPTAIDLTLNWLLNLYDTTRSGRISVLSIKVGLTLICCATREEKYIYMFELISDSDSQTVDAKSLRTLCEVCARIPAYFGESESFGGPDLIDTTVRSCLAMSKFKPQYPNRIGLNDYLNWLKTEPQFIIWLPVLHRMLISENVTHHQKCKLCGSNPIVGLRYRCLKCLKFNICQKCFLTGRHVYEHYDPAKHPLREYCCLSNISDQVRDFTKIFRSAII